LDTVTTTADGLAPGGSDDEPPGSPWLESEAEEEPPGTTLDLNRRRFFAGVSDASWSDWRWHFRNRITTIEELAQYIPLPAKQQARSRSVLTKYPMAITPYYLCLMDPSDPTDPIRKQAIPSFDELGLAGIGCDDPLGEEEGWVTSGLVHRYPDRVLMVLTDICPMLCRHCTRKREWRNGGWVRTAAEIDAMMRYIQENRKVRDVVISGGDPLSLSTRRLEEVLSRLRQIRHVEIIRIGTRFPVVLPQRIDDELCAVLSRYGPIWLNTQFNHRREITPDSASACDRLLRSGVPVSNQSVLLKGINDTAECQIRLCHELLKAKVRPYYLYQCDEVRGTEHLRTPVETGLRIVEQMRGHTSGLAVPTFVVDLPHGGGKVPLQPDYLLRQSGEYMLLRNYEGKVFRYRNPGQHSTHKDQRRNGNGGRRKSPPLTGRNGTLQSLEGASRENRTVVRP